MTLTTLKMRSDGWRGTTVFNFTEAGPWYQTTFDTRGKENSPGYCLLAKILIEACEMNTFSVVVDMGLRAEAYKEWFANSTR